MLELIVFFFFAAIAVAFALIVVLHRNPVVGALSLVVSFFALAVMYVLLEAPFMAALQVIVYAGAIMVLFLFVIMLLNLQHQHEEPTRPIQQFLGFTGGAAFAITLVYYISKGAFLATTGASGKYITDAGAIGRALFSTYVFPFEAVSILLIAAIVGALVLSQRSTTAERKAEKLPPKEHPIAGSPASFPESTGDAR
jgi:NADH-quinone oxidoreductase subunit J